MKQYILDKTVFKLLHANTVKLFRFLIILDPISEENTLVDTNIWFYNWENTGTVSFMSC